MKNGFIFFLFISFICISTSKSTDREKSITQLKSNLEFLASDELEGREATSHSEKVASLFIAQELNKYGIKPCGDSGSFFQNFNMYVVSTNENKTSLVVSDGNGNKETLQFGDEFVINKSPIPSELFSDKNYRVVFAGFGIESESENYSDYKNIDVQGKIVVVIPGSPLESQKNMRLTKLKRIKENIAAQKGAAAIIQLIGKEYNARWPMIKYYLNSPTFKLESEIEAQDKEAIPSIILSYEAGEKLLAGEMLSNDQIDSISNSGSINNYFEFKKKIYLSFDFNKELRPTRNVIGVLEGTDEKLKHEYVTIGAHYDHLGAYNGKIYNGADDNGSGTVSVLELARLMSAEKRNKRSVVFAFHTGEEKGLKGAKYLTSHSEDIINNAVVNINLDMIGRESIDTIYTVGSGRLSTELYNLIKEVNSNTVNFVLDYKFDAPNDPQDIYNRSDHKHYADKGIPVVFFFDEMTEDYHRHTDTVDKINFEKMYKVIELSKALINKVSNLDHKLKVDSDINLINDGMEEKN